MMKIERIIKKRKKEQFYNYYMSLGYDHKTSASLALFTYGQYRFEDFSMDELYEALCRGREYLPREEIERRERWELEMKQMRELSSNVRGIGARITGTRPTGARRVKSSSVDFGDFGAGDTIGFSAAEIVGELEDNAADYMAEESICCGSMAPLPTSMAPLSAGMAPHLMSVTGALDFATDEYESIEEKGPSRTVDGPVSTFRMTTNTASAGVILNQLRNGRRIDRSMVRIEEMLNYFRYDSKSPRTKCLASPMK